MRGGGGGDKKNKAKPIVFTPPPPGCLQSEDCSPTEPAPPEVSWTCLLNSAVHHKLCLHVYLNAVTPPSRSVLYSVHTELWGSEVSPSESPVYQTPLFWVSVLTFLQFLPVSRQVQVLGSHVMGMAAKSPFSDLIWFGSLAIGLLILFSFSNHQLFPSLILCTRVVFWFLNFWLDHICFQLLIWGLACCFSKAYDAFLVICSCSCFVTQIQWIWTSVVCSISCKFCCAVFSCLFNSGIFFNFLDELIQHPVV